MAAKAGAAKTRKHADGAAKARAAYARRVEDPVRQAAHLGKRRERERSARLSAAPEPFLWRERLGRDPRWAALSAALRGVEAQDRDDVICDAWIAMAEEPGLTVAAALSRARTAFWAASGYRRTRSLWGPAGGSSLWELLEAGVVRAAPDWDGALVTPG